MSAKYMLAKIPLFRSKEAARRDALLSPVQGLYTKSPKATARLINQELSPRSIMFPPIIRKPKADIAKNTEAQPVDNKPNSHIARRDAAPRLAARGAVSVNRASDEPRSIKVVAQKSTPVKRVVDRPSPVRSTVDKGVDRPKSSSPLTNGFVGMPTSGRSSERRSPQLVQAAPNMAMRESRRTSGSRIPVAIPTSANKENSPPRDGLSTFDSAWTLVSPRKRSPRDSKRRASRLPVPSASFRRTEGRRIKAGAIQSKLDQNSELTPDKVTKKADPKPEEKRNWPKSAPIFPDVTYAAKAGSPARLPTLTRLTPGSAFATPATGSTRKSVRFQGTPFPATQVTPAAVKASALRTESRYPLVNPFSTMSFGATKPKPVVPEPVEVETPGLFRLRDELRVAREHREQEAREDTLLSAARDRPARPEGWWLHEDQDEEEFLASPSVAPSQSRLEASKKASTSLGSRTQREARAAQPKESRSKRDVSSARERSIGRPSVQEAGQVEDGRFYLPIPPQLSAMSIDGLTNRGQAQSKSSGIYRLAKAQLAQSQRSLSRTQANAEETSSFAAASKASGSGASDASVSAIQELSKVIEALRKSEDALRHKLDLKEQENQQLLEKLGHLESIHEAQGVMLEQLETSVTEQYEANVLLLERSADLESAEANLEEVIQVATQLEEERDAANVQAQAVDTAFRIAIQRFEAIFLEETGRFMPVAWAEHDALDSPDSEPIPQAEDVGEESSWERGEPSNVFEGDDGLEEKRRQALLQRGQICEYDLAVFIRHGVIRKAVDGGYEGVEPPHYRVSTIPSDMWWGEEEEPTVILNDDDLF